MITRIDSEYDERHEFIAHDRVSQRDGGRRDAGLFNEDGLDFAEFDAKSTNLDLPVAPTEIGDLAILVDPAEVASQVKPGFVGSARERIFHEPFGGQFGTAEITQGDARPEDGQLANFARRQRTSRLVEYHHPIVRQSSADRYRPPRLQRGERRRNGRLGGGRQSGRRCGACRSRSGRRGRTGLPFLSLLLPPPSPRTRAAWDWGLRPCAS